MRKDFTPEERFYHDVIDRLQERGLFDAVRKIARDHHVALEALIGKARHGKAAAAARHAAWRELHYERGLSWPEVAEVFGRKHDCITQARTQRYAGAAQVAAVVRWIRVENVEPLRRALAKGQAHEVIGGAQLVAMEALAEGIERGLWAKKALAEGIERGLWAKKKSR